MVHSPSSLKAQTQILLGGGDTEAAPGDQQGFFSLSPCTHSLCLNHNAGYPESTWGTQLEQHQSWGATRD